jgi:hypothetical protein
MQLTNISYQNNGSSCARYTFLYSYAVGPPLSHNMACILIVKVERGVEVR